MNLILRFDDSEVAQVVRVGGDLHIRFSAASVQTADGAVGSAVVGWARGVELVVIAAGLSDPANGAMESLTNEPKERPLNGLIGRIAQGRVALSGQWAGRVVLPSQAQVPIQIELVFANKGTLSVAGQGLVCRFKAEPHFTESLAC